MDIKRMNFVLIPEEELDSLKENLQEILRVVKTPEPANGVRLSHITAKEFMTAVRICRSKFDQLVAAGKISTIKKKRKIYVPLSEVNRYFTDPSIQ